MTCDRGWHRKFCVKRVDGQGEAGEKHFGCEYFVLDLTHDDSAWPALEAYTLACREQKPQLAKDIMQKVRMAIACRALVRSDVDGRRGPPPPPIVELSDLVRDDG